MKLLFHHSSFKTFCKAITVLNAFIASLSSNLPTLIAVDGVPTCITRSNKRASDIVSYLSGYEVEINDRKLKKQLDKIRDMN